MATLFVDLMIIAGLTLVALDGYRRGFLLSVIELGTALLAFFLASYLTAPVGNLLGHFFHLPALFLKSIGFTVAWFILQGVLLALCAILYKRFLPESIKDSIINKVVGIVPALIKGVIFIAVILTLLVILPIAGNLRPAISESRLGKPLVSAVQAAEQQLFRRYESELNETLTFLTNTPLRPKQPQSDEFVSLQFKTTDVRVDEASEQILLTKVNQERVKIGLKPLVLNKAFQEVARAHARDMLARGYFAHVNPDGQDPFDRLEKAGLSYTAAGENLALAPTVELAHTGLMNSPKHKENILYPEFGQVGIGVIDAGIYGKMFVQEFRD